MDPYAPCPCGSGKKVKFCCQAILPEMAKIEKLQENNQPRMALQLIDKLLKNHADNPWLVTQRAMALLSDERFAEARDTLVPFLRKNPDHPLANGMLGVAMTELEPYPACKKVVHRALLKCSSSEPGIAALLARVVAMYHFNESHVMAFRQHLALAARYLPESERNDTLESIFSFDGDTQIPYPLRGVHHLPKFEPPAEIATQYRKAMKIALVGCFEEAADLVEQALPAGGARPELWHTVGLLRAWDGDESRAAEALHRAAKLYEPTNLQLAVDLESVAQLLEAQLPENAVTPKAAELVVESMSRLLTRLDNEDRLVRTDHKTPDGDSTTRYVILDRPVPTDAELAELTLDRVPQVIGQLTITDAGENHPAVAVVSGVEGSSFEAAMQTVLNASGELVRHPSADEEIDVTVQNPLYRIAREDWDLLDNDYLPATTPAAVTRRLQQEGSDRRNREKWINSPRRALDGKSPREVKGDPAYQLRLEAAVIALESLRESRGEVLNVEEMRQQLGLPAAESIEPSDDDQLDLKSLSIPQLRRIKLSALTDEQVLQVMARVQSMRHLDLTRHVLLELLENRPALLESDLGFGMAAYSMLADILHRIGEVEQARAWYRKGIDWACRHNASFQDQAVFKMRLLRYYAADPTDPALKELLLELWERYGAKIPSLRQHLELVVASLNIEPPWQSSIVTAQTIPTAGQSLWEPASEQSVTGEKKLWLPD